MFKQLVLLTILTSIIFIGCTVNNSEFVKEYNDKLDEANSLLMEHDKIVEEINSNLNNIEINRQKMREYLNWVDENRETLTEFKLFIESNYKEISNAGVNPDYVRENVVTTLNIIQENELRFRTILRE